MKNKRPAISSILLFGLTATLFAHAPTVIVEYYENTSGEMYVRTSDGTEYDVDQFGFGEELPVGTTLITLDGDYAELRMDPNGTIIRVGENTNFRVDGLQVVGMALQQIGQLLDDEAPQGVGGHGGPGHELHLVHRSGGGGTGLRA